MKTPIARNDLLIIRRRYGLTRKQVAAILGYKSTGAVARHERGIHIPDLITALKLEILYRLPVASLYADLYGKLRDEVRAAEAVLLKRGGEHA